MDEKTNRAAALAALEEAGSWENADTGWKGNLPAEERIARRNADTAEAQVYATLALGEVVAGLALGLGKTLGTVGGKLGATLEGILGELEAGRSTTESGLAEIREALEAIDGEDLLRLDRTLGAGLTAIADAIS